MARKGRLPPAAASEIIGVRDVAPQDRQFLFANPLDGLGVETRLGQREPQQLEGLVAMFVQRAQRAVKCVAANLKADLDCVVFQPLMKGLAVQLAGAFVEQIGGEMRCPGLAGVILAGSATESVIQRDQWYRLLAHQPGFDS